MIKITIKIHTKKTRTYPNGAVLNYMKYRLSSNYSKGGYSVFCWKRGEVLWDNQEYHEDRVNIYYFQDEDDTKTKEEINELLKKKVRNFRVFYRAAKNICLMSWEKLEERYIRLENEYRELKLKNEFGKDFIDELYKLSEFYHVYWLEYDGKKEMSKWALQKMTTILNTIHEIHKIQKEQNVVS